jgi:hypothetical protein
MVPGHPREKVSEILISANNPGMVALTGGIERRLIV